MAQLLIPRELQQLDRSTYKLTQLAKRVAMPNNIVGTDWGAVADTCRDEMGIVFDGWQDGMGELMLARSTPEALHEGGMLAHTIGGFNLSAMRQIGKAAAVDTPLLTANRGWTTFGEIEVGDSVFHASGQAVAVTWKSSVIFNHDCYEVTTTDGRSIVVDGEHLWTVKDKRLAGHPWRDLSTAEMASDGLGRSPHGERTVITDGKPYQTTEYRFVLPRQHGIHDGLPHADLAIDPYLLGAWLGNGDAHAAAITSGTEDVDHWHGVITAAGFVPRATLQKRELGSAWHISIRDDDGDHRRLRSLQGSLDGLGLLRNKHIPEMYLIASAHQRLSLLQGLLDTDGHITKQAGTVEFCSMTKDLADGVLFLARSLGWRATIKEGKAKLNGKDYGTKYRTIFTPKMSDPYVPFRLQRKIDRIGQTDSGKGRFTVSIKSIERVATRPVRCIKVAAEDGLFLAGRDLVATHNTFWGAGALFGLCQHYPGLLVIWTSHHTKTTSETFESMQGFAKRRLIEPFIEKVYTGSGDEMIKFWNGSRIMFGARERGFPRGIPGVDVLFNDEGQIMSEKAQQASLATMNTSWLGLHIYAGTPPSAEEIDKAKAWMRKHDEAWLITDPEVITVETEDFVWVEFGADNGADLDDVRQWAKNPSVPHRTPFHAVQRLRRNLNDDGMRREGLGLYDEDEGSIFNMKRWADLGIDDAEQPMRASLVLDVSPNREWAALGIAAEHDDEHTLVLVKSIKGTAAAVAEIAKLANEKDLITVRITPGAARAVETQLTKAAIEYEIAPAAEVAAAYGTLQEAIKDATIVHLGQSELTFALQNTKSRFLQTGESESFDRRDYSVDTSPAVAVAVALYDFGINNTPMPLMM